MSGIVDIPKGLRVSIPFVLLAGIAGRNFGFVVVKT